MGEPVPDAVGEAGPADVVDLLAVMSYTLLSAVSRLACDAEQAPTLSQRVALADLAVAEHQRFCRLSDRIGELGADPQAAMAPFVAPVDAFHDRTRPQDWPERLVKAYVSDAIGSDFHRAIGGFVDQQTRQLIEDVAGDGQRTVVVAHLVRESVGDDPRLAGRLSLWARRLVGEALSQAHRVVVDRPGFARLVGAAGPADDLTDVAQLFAGLTDRHAMRMRELGLSP